MPMRARLGLVTREMVGSFMQGFDDPALRTGSVATVAQFDQIALQHPQFALALSYMGDVRFQCLIGGLTVCLSREVQPQQCANLIERHVHRAAQPDETQLMDVALAIAAVAVLRAHTLGQQAGFFVEADVGRSDATARGSLSDKDEGSLFHGGLTFK